MKKISVLCISVIIALSIGCSGSSSAPATPENNDQIKTDTSKTEAQAYNYVCPMGKECGYSNEPGKCKSCGMDLMAAK